MDLQYFYIPPQICGGGGQGLISSPGGQGWTGRLFRHVGKFYRIVYFMREEEEKVPKKNHPVVRDPRCQMKMTDVRPWISDVHRQMSDVRSENIA